MNKLSVVINTLNEEKNIVNCIDSIKEIADEIIVVDMNSDDNTQELAQKNGAKLFSHKRMGYVEPARNFAISKATGEWIFIIDADEEITKSLAKKIRSAVEKNTSDYCLVPRKNIVFGKWLKHSRWWPDYNIRLFRKGYVKWSDEIHSVPLTVGNGEDFEAIEENAIIHNHYTNIDQYIDRLNRYTTYQAKSLVEKKYSFEWEDLIKKPTGEFLSRYFYGQGYKDGLHGLALSLLQSFSEIVVYLKVWQMSGFKEKDLNSKKVISEIKKNQKEINYWSADLLYKEGGGVAQLIKRKFKIS